MPDPKKRILRVFKINEISGVDNPAQAGAQALIIKRYGGADMPLPKDVDPEALAELAKSIQEGLAAIQAGTAKDQVEVLKSLDALQKALGKPAEGINTREVEKLQKQLAEANALASLSDLERVYHTSLSKVEQEGFIKLDSNARATAMLVAKGSDPVVYTTLEGLVLRKSVGELMISIAKSNDALRKQNEFLTTKSATEELRKRTAELIPFVPGDEQTRMDIVKAVESITDEERRKKATDILRAQNAEFGKKFKTAGHQGEPSDNTPVANLDTLAKSYQTKEKVSLAQAYDAVLLTTEGQELYAKSVSITAN